MPARITDPSILQTIKLAQDIAGEQEDEIRPDFIVTEVERMSPQELEKQACLEKKIDLASSRNCSVAVYRMVPNGNGTRLPEYREQRKLLPGEGSAVEGAESGWCDLGTADGQAAGGRLCHSAGCCEDAD